MDVKELVVRTVRKFIAKDTLSLGAALAYYTTFSLVPLLVIALAIAGAFFGDKAAQGRLSDELTSTVGPEVATAIEKTLETARSTGSTSTATLAGVIGLLFGAAGVFGQLQTSLNLIWEVPPGTNGGWWAWLKARFLSFAMVLGAGFLLIVSLIASTLVTGLCKYTFPGESFAVQSVNQALSFAMVTLLFSLIFKVLPGCEIDWRDVWIGAAVTAALFTLGKFLLELYLSRTHVSSAYGTAGSLAVILVWVYYASQILLFGAQFTQVCAELRFEVGDPPPTDQPKRNLKSPGQGSESVATAHSTKK